MATFSITTKLDIYRLIKCGQASVTLHVLQARFLPEMHRVLKPEESLAVWLFPVAGWVPKSILQSGLFTYICKRIGVYIYRRCLAGKSMEIGDKIY